MDLVSVCKNVIGSNNKRGWNDPAPAIRVSRAKHGKVVTRAHELGILDSEGNIVAKVVSTKDGQPVIGCGAKVAIITEYDTVSLDP